MPLSTFDYELMLSNKVLASNTLSIALGANISSPIGSPSKTLIAVRPLIEKTICEWISLSLKEEIHIQEIYSCMNWDWSPIFETDPIGGPPSQPKYMNAVMLVKGGPIDLIEKNEIILLKLLKRILELEKTFGRKRTENSSNCEPRSIDIDLLGWGDLQINSKDLVIPHPRLLERSFVIFPLAATLSNSQTIPKQLKPQKDWPEKIDFFA